MSRAAAPISRGCLAALLLVATSLGGCTARRVFAPAVLPAPQEAPADFGDIRLYLRDVRVVGMSSKDKPAAVHELRRALSGMIERRSAFREVENDAKVPKELDLPATVLDVKMTVDHSAWRTYALDAFAAIWFAGVIWPFYPQWGEAQVNLTATLFNDGGGILWEGTSTGIAPYFMLAYSWFRTRLIEEAYRNAYGKAFTEIATQLAGQRDRVVAAVGERPRTRVASTSSIGVKEDNTVSIALLPTYVDEKIRDELPPILDDHIMATVQDAGDYRVTGQADIEAMLGFEAQKQLTGCDDASCVAEIGMALGVDYVMLLRVAKVEADWMVTGKLINIDEQTVESRFSEFVDGGTKALLKKLPDFVHKLLANRTRS